MEHRCLQYCYTTLGTSHGRSIYIEQCTYTHGRFTPLQMTIDALNTATPKLAHLMADIYIYIYNNALIPMEDCPPAIEHRCLEYHYTKIGTSNGLSIYICHRHGIQVKEKMERFRCNYSIQGFHHACWQMCRQMAMLLMCMHSGCPTRRSKQMIMIS